MLVYFRHRQHPGAIKGGIGAGLCVHFHESALQHRVAVCVWGSLQQWEPFQGVCASAGSRASLGGSLNLSLWGLTPPKKLPSEVCSILRNSLLSSSEFTWNMPLQNKLGSALDIAPVTESVLQFEVLSQPGVLIQISSELSLILLFLRNIITIFRISLHFLRI